MSRHDFTGTHTTYCQERSVGGFLKMVPADNCGTCSAWWAGYKAALTPIPDEGDDDDSE